MDSWVKIVGLGPNAGCFPSLPRPAAWRSTCARPQKEGRWWSGELGVWVAVDRPASSEDVSSRIFVH